MVKTAVATKQRDVRLLELTASELKQLGKDTKVYDGVGKMYVRRFFYICVYSLEQSFWMLLFLFLVLKWEGGRGLKASLFLKIGA